VAQLAFSLRFRRLVPLYDKQLVPVTQYDSHTMERSRGASVQGDTWIHPGKPLPGDAYTLFNCMGVLCVLVSLLILFVFILLQKRLKMVQAPI